MIASFSNNFIFIKTRKTAGTSIELALARLCGDDDIITPIGGDERVRWKNGWRGGQNFAKDPDIMKAYADIVKQRDGDRTQELGRLLRKRGEFYEHMPAEKLAGKLETAFWSRAYKWTVERHPYEKAVSQTYFRMWRNKIDARSFDAVLSSLIEKNALSERRKYTIDGRVAVDEIIKFEELSIAFPRLLAKLGMRLDGEMPHAKGSQRGDRRPAREILSRDQKDRIYASCRATFEMLGYER